ncbi:thiopeptide-type bacteriocin biosynthesis protein [Kitasatospora sp. MAP12-15]|uniref:thiopeptide-type bacteriocin biosynthesis protein n=1 Tax=unclassified Kitasatospora TaxID=2633591 RepID=UPI002474B901|nr:thiopeptide-type bacteriocin biosynthesis protein [Kitasatospora sp. MAP12-44]MDH6115217.1 thiopeptide-type bacteriocin biosynthesis protein [Kitasatospora sp. MAP12-44]
MADWHSFHLFLHSDTAAVDAVLTEELAPLLDGLVADGQAAAWFFIRYGEGGPHLRIRLRGLTPSAAAELPDMLSRLGKAVPAVEGPWPSTHAEVQPVPYVAETERYGGAAALPEAEELFAVSSRVAVLALRRPPRAADRLALGIDLAHTTALALGLGPLAAARWLRRHAAGWRWVTEVPLLPGAAVHARVNAVFALQHEALVRRAETLRAGLEREDAAPWLLAWAAAVRGSEGRELWVWASQLHMLFNRLGISPDEERAVCRLAARTLLDAGEPPSFFPEGHRAPDRQYLERSKFQAGRPQDSALRLLPSDLLSDPLEGSQHSAPPEVALPAGPLPERSLHEVTTARVSARGALVGPLDAGTLGTLLWSSHAESHRTERWLPGQRLPEGAARSVPHRPYPSAGALYTARLRLIALNVDGLSAGTYQCVPERRVLRPVGPAPSVAELTALSSYFSRPADDPDLVDITDAPAVLGLYVDFGLLRRRYGLRALRLGLLEAGHLAQTLLLSATALGLSSIPLSGFLDDLAHELLGLDDLDQPLQYLLPLGHV